MCDTCGCSVTDGNRDLANAPVPEGATTIDVLGRLLAANDHEAAHNREHFARHGVLAINLMSSPGAGKTALLEATIEALAGRIRVGVIEGDLETENDADRIRAKGVPAFQITTGTACHLDAHMVHHALHEMPIDELDIVFIENVGNLVCPASFDLGHHINVTLLSVTEGDDKPAKYPVMFRAANLMLVTKTDLLQYLPEFSPDRAEGYFRKLANPSPVLHVSNKAENGLDAWLAWLEDSLARFKAGESFTPAVQPDGAQMHAAQVDATATPHHHHHEHGHHHHEHGHHHHEHGHHHHEHGHHHHEHGHHSPNDPVVGGAE